MTEQRLGSGYQGPEEFLRRVCGQVPDEMARRRSGDVLAEVVEPVRAQDIAQRYLGFAPLPAEDGNNEVVSRFRRVDGLTVWLAIRDDLSSRVLGMCAPPGEVPGAMSDPWYPLPTLDVAGAVDYVCDWLLLAEPESVLWDEVPGTTALRELVVASIPLSCYYVRRYDDAPEQTMVWFHRGRSDYVIAFIFTGDDVDAPIVMHCKGGNMGPVMPCRDIEHASDYITHCLTTSDGEENDANIHN